MKTLLLLAVLLIGFTSCKKDDGFSQPGAIVISKIFRNGILDTEYLYDPDKGLARINSYNTTTGKLSSYGKFEYDTRGFLESSSSYNASGKISSETTYLKASDGKLISADFQDLNGTDSGKITIRYKFEYNGAGQISKHSWNDPVSGEEESYRLFFYYPNGNLEHYEYYLYLYNNPVPEKAMEVSYLPAGNPLPKSISKHKGYPVNFTIFLLAAGKIQYKTYDTGYFNAGEYEWVISKRQYNAEDFVTEQTITTNYIQPAKPSTVEEISFVYQEVKFNYD